MTRAQQTLSILLLVSSLYLVLYLGLIPLPPTIQEEIIPYLPAYFVMAFPAYLLFRLGWGVFTFKDVPEAHESLQAEIEIAKKALRAGNVDID
ncbi:hypothetical protein FQN54_002382 [Arachnomyces sp. PD_36]|nr:hypothetical protein FQN54_002382 [Arachnomyces sp. PD_36]